MHVPLLHHAERRFAADSDLRARFGDARSLAYWQWLLAEAWPRDAQLQRLLPVPPPALIARSAGAHADAAAFHDSGLVDAGSMFERLAQAGFAPAAGARLLDFGCGPGRLLRPWTRFAGELELHGADVDVDAISWVRTHLPWTQPAAIASDPPLPYPDEHFAAAFAFAVFSQLAEPLQRAWLAELARVLRPGALLVLTTHGTTCAERFAAGAVPLFPFPPAARIAAELPVLQQEGWLFHPYPPTVGPTLPTALRSDGRYGVAFVTRDHVRAHWLAAFELVAHHEAPRGFLDEIVLRRRQSRGDAPGPNSD